MTKPSLAEFLLLTQSLLTEEDEKALPFPGHLDRFVEHVENGGQLVVDLALHRRAARLAEAEVRRMYALATEASEQHEEMAASFVWSPLRDDLVRPGHAHPHLHPTGACTCGGEGACTWCRTHCPDCGRTPRHAGPCERPIGQRRWKRGQKRNRRQRRAGRARHAGTVRVQKAQALLRHECEAWPGHSYSADMVDASALTTHTPRIGGVGILRPEMKA